MDVCILKTWMGSTSGSHLGRDDGYPERKFILVESMDDLVQGYRLDAEYFTLSRIDVSEVVKAANALTGGEEP